MSIQFHPAHESIIKNGIKNKDNVEEIYSLGIVVTEIDFKNNPFIAGFGTLSKCSGVVVKTNEKETFKLNETVFFHTEKFGLYEIFAEENLFKTETELVEWAKNGGKSRIETTKKPDKIDMDSDAGFMGVVDIVSYLYKNSVSETKYHLIKVTRSIITRRKINELCVNKNDPKEINRYYKAKSYFKRLVREKKEQLKNSPKKMCMDDYEGLKIVAAKKFNLDPKNLNSVIKASERAVRTAETMLKSIL